MKKLIFAILLSVFFMGVHAQQPVDFGAKAGVNVSNVKGKGTDGYNVSSRTSFNAGLFMRYFIATAVAIRPELFYGGHGFEESGVRHQFSSLFLPILFMYYLQSFYLMAGPQLSYLLSAHAKSSGGETNIRNSYNALNFALVAGLGYMLTSHLGIDARYVFGLGDIQKNGTAAIQNSIFSLSLMWMFLGR